MPDDARQPGAASARAGQLAALHASVPMPFTGPGMCPLCSSYGEAGRCPDRGCENYGGPVNDDY